MMEQGCGELQLAHLDHASTRAIYIEQVPAPVGCFGLVFDDVRAADRKCRGKSGSTSRSIKAVLA
jgi:hypothetical protein